LRKRLTNIFEEKWGATSVEDSQHWEECSRVLSRSDIEKRMSLPW
jgi:hypothetical protein